MIVCGVDNVSECMGQRLRGRGGGFCVHMPGRVDIFFRGAGRGRLFADGIVFAETGRNHHPVQRHSREHSRSGSSPCDQQHTKTERGSHHACRDASEKTSKCGSYSSSPVVVLYLKKAVQGGSVPRRPESGALLVVFGLRSIAGKLGKVCVCCIMCVRTAAPLIQEEM